jgi:hypothetical protein
MQLSGKCSVYEGRLHARQDQCHTRNILVWVSRISDIGPDEFEAELHSPTWSGLWPKRVSFSSAARLGTAKNACDLHNEQHSLRHGIMKSDINWLCNIHITVKHVPEGENRRDETSAWRETDNTT